MPRNKMSLNDMEVRENNIVPTEMTGFVMYRDLTRMSFVFYCILFIMYLLGEKYIEKFE